MLPVAYQWGATKAPESAARSLPAEITSSGFQIPKRALSRLFLSLTRVDEWPGSGAILRAFLFSCQVREDVGSSITCSGYYFAKLCSQMILPSHHSPWNNTHHRRSKDGFTLTCAAQDWLVPPSLAARMTPPAKIALYTPRFTHPTRLAGSGSMLRFFPIYRRPMNSDLIISFMLILECDTLPNK